jgi:hypothetical protein
MPGCTSRSPRSTSVVRTFLRGVRVNLQLLAEDPHRWKPVATLQLAGDDRLGDREDKLIVKRTSRSQGDAERK